MDPPLVGLAVNVTSVPAQIVLPGLTEIVTVTGTLGFTVVTMLLLAAVIVVRQVPPATLISTVTASLFTSVGVV